MPRMSKKKAKYWRGFRKFRKLMQKYIDEKKRYSDTMHGQPWVVYQEIKDLMKELGSPLRSPW